jgi:hypothetical protein
VLDCVVLLSLAARIQVLGSATNAVACGVIVVGVIFKERGEVEGDGLRVPLGMHFIARQAGQTEINGERDE